MAPRQKSFHCASITSHSTTVPHHQLPSVVTENFEKDHRKSLVADSIRFHRIGTIPETTNDLLEKPVLFQQNFE
jgi:hypothetical protein